MFRSLLPLLVSLFLFTQGWAFSPYENYLATGRDTQVGLLAQIEEGQGDALAKAVASLEEGKPARQLKKAGISGLATFSRNIEGKDYAVIRFVYAGGKDYLGAAKAFEEATAQVEWRKIVAPHPRAVTYGRTWLQMEWINYIRGYDVDREPSNSLMIGCRVRPEMEMQYRTLHQTVWPGVVDQAVRGKIRDLCVFLVELDDDLVEFLYLDYMGDDQAADDAANAADPINQRWWKLTDACQMPFSDVEEGIWTLMNPVPAQ
ncbi:MAG: L-rhamnose mutarotase [Verrucomicrobiota bacterium JB022]|nr:L-rhamnose mutarotase [Verrucomicrobiota bacterium JB022]